MKHTIIAHLVSIDGKGNAIGAMHCPETGVLRPLKTDKAVELRQLPPSDLAVDIMHQMALAMVAEDIKAGRELPEGYTAELWVDCKCALAVFNLMPTADTIAFIRENEAKKPKEK